MATERDTSTVGGFGEVSRTVGTVFRYLLLAATLFGLVVLGVLLMYVTYDAIQPQTADPGWYLTFFVTFVGPSLVAAGYLSRRTDRGLRVGLYSLGILVVGTLFGAGASLLFVATVPPLVWLSFYLALSIPGVAVVALERSRLPFLAKLLATFLVLGISLAVVPGFVQTVPFIPTDGVIVGLTFGVPTALVVRSIAVGRWENDRTVTAATGAGLVVPVLAGFVGPFVGLGPIESAVLATTVLVPFGLYVAILVHEGAPRRVGLAFPVVVVGGALLGAALVGVLGFAGPQSWLDWQFLTSNHNNDPTQAGVYAALIGSILLMLIVMVLSFPLGVGAAIYLEEYAPNNRWTRLIDINISNLAGVPSVVYGLLGLGLFVNFLDAGFPVVPGFVASALSVVPGVTITPVSVYPELFNPGTLLVGGAALSLLILPIIIVSAREAVRAVPASQREASYGMGATRWQTIRNVVLPKAFPGILTGTILALGRAIGETAPLLVIGAPAVFDPPTQLDSSVGAVPLQIYEWAATFATPAFYQKALPAGVVTLLVMLLAMNSVAIVLRNEFERES